MNSKSRAVVFDFDGTIADSAHVVVDIYNEIAKRDGFDQASLDELPRLRKMGYRKTIKSKGVHVWQLQNIGAEISAKMKSHMDSVRPYEGMVDALSQLANSGYIMGILTSNSTEVAEALCDNFDLKVFDFVWSEKRIFGKARPLRKVMAEYGLSPDDLIYVGDEPRDIAAANKAKCQSIAVEWGLGGKESFEGNCKVQPTAVISDPKELVPAVESLLNSGGDGR